MILDSKTNTISYKAIGVSEESIERKGNIFSSVFTLVSTMIGGGLLSLPFAFQQGGFAVSSFVLFFTFVSSTYGAFLIINSKKYCSGRVKNIEDVAKVAFGKNGQRVVQILLIVLLYLSSVAYFILITEQMSPIVYLLFGQNTIWSKKITLLTIVFVIVFPISLMKNLSTLSFTSSLSVVCGIFLCVCVIYRSSTSGFGGPVNDKYNPIVWYPRSIGGFLTCVSIAEVGYSCHFNVLPMYDELRFQTRKNKRIILLLAMGITYAMNIIISFFGYSQFRKYTDQDITTNYSSNDNIVTCGRVAFCLVLLLSYPLLIVPCRASINKMIWTVEDTPLKILSYVSKQEANGPNRVCWFLETMMIVGTSFILAYLVPQVNMVWGVVGAVGCTMSIYILPPAFYLRVRRHPAKADFKKVFAILLLIMGFFMLIAGMYQAIINIVSPLHVINPPKCIHNDTSAYHKQSCSGG